METDMRKVWLVLMAALLLFSAALMPVAAEAMPGPVRVAGPSSLLDRVYCRRIWVAKTGDVAGITPAGVTARIGDDSAGAMRIGAGCVGSVPDTGANVVETTYVVL
jgi:hypothetical protein